MVLDLGIDWVRDVDFGNWQYVRFRCGCAALVGHTDARPRLNPNYIAKLDPAHASFFFHSAPVDVIVSPWCNHPHSDP